MTLLSLGVNAQCDYTITLNDTYGDGWNGNTLDVTVAGVLTQLTVASGSGGVPVTISSFSGDSVTFAHSGTSYPAENFFTIVAPDGTSLYDVAAGGASGWSGSDVSNSTCLQCNYTITGSDQYDDGWDGGSIDIDVDGTVTNYAHAAGANGTSFSLPSLTGDAVTFTWNAGSYDSEVTFDILAPNGTSLGSFGPSPTVGLLFSDVSNSVCAPPACDYTITLSDDYGDGWNGNTLDVTVAGVLTQLTVASGYGGVPVTISSFSGDAVTFAHSGSSYPDENFFTIVAPDGTLLYDVAAGGAASGWSGSDVSNSNCAPPACSVPTDVLATNITATDAELNYLPGAGSAVTAYNFEVQLAGDPQGTVPSVYAGTNTGTTHYLTSLTANTTYDYYIQSDCSADLSSWTSHTFTTLCGISSLPWNEGFDNGGAIPGCWTMAGGENWVFSNTTGSNHIGNYGTLTGNTTTGGYFAWVDASGSQSPATLTSPSVEVGSLITPQLSFFENSDNEGGDNSQLDVEVWDGSAWNSMATYNTNTAGWEERVIPLVGLTFTGPAQVRFTFSEPVSGAYVDDIAIDDVSFEEAPACVAPTTLAANSITATTADLTWVDAAASGLSNVEYGVTGFTQGSGIMITGTANTTESISVLSAQTTYQFYVQSNCGTDQSAWAGPFPFTTLCDAVSSFPYTENFDGSLTAGVWDCWTVINNDGGNTWSQASNYITPNSGAYTAHGMGNNDDYLISPALAVGATPLRAKFWDVVESASYNNTYTVKVSTTGTAMADFTDVLSTFDCTNTSLVEHIVDLSAYSNQTIYVAFHQTYSAATYYGFGIDDFTVEEVPACEAPSGLNTTLIKATSANLTWVASASPVASYNWEVQLAGDPQGTVTTLPSGTGVSGLLVGTGAVLTSNTAYDFFVQTNCGSTTSAWFGPGSFTTSCSAANSVEFSLTTGSYGGEVSWELVDASLNVVASGSGYGNYTTYASTLCLTPDSVYTFNAYDSYGDSWNGGTYEIGLCNGATIFANNGGGTPDNGAAGSGLESSESFTFIAPLAEDITISSISSPASACVLTATEAVTVEFTNVGANETTGPVVYQVFVNGNLEFTDYYTPTLYPCNAVTVTSVTSGQVLDLSIPGSYDIEVVNIYPYDMNSANDTIRTTIVSIPTVNNFPYTQDFEGTGGGWTSGTTGGIANSWEHGSPTGTIISAAGQGSEAWVTNLDGDFSNDELSYLISPCMDLTGVPTPRMSFGYIFAGGNFSDDLAIEGSIDGGLTWATMSSYTSDQATWTTDDISLDILANESDVRIRLFFGSNWNTVSEGFGFDNVEIYNQPCAFPASNQSVSNITAYAATLSFTAGGDDPAANGPSMLEYGLSGFTPGLVSGQALGTDTFSVLSGLLAATTYDWYVLATCVAGDSSVWTGPNSFTTMVSCPAPSGLMLDGVTAISADVSWSTTNATNYILEYGLDGFTPGDGTGVIVSATDTFASVTGLTISTTYDWYVRAYCSAGDTSFYANSSFFTGYCIPTYSSGTLYGDLISEVSITGTTLLNNTGSTNGTPAYTYFNGGGTETGDLSAGTSYDVVVTSGSYPGGQNFTAWIDFNDNLIFEESERIGSTSAQTTLSYQVATFTITLPCDPSVGVHRMRVRDVWNAAGSTLDPCSNYGYGETEDYDVNVLAPPPCPQILSLAADSISSDYAEITWMMGCSEGLWDIEVGTNSVPSSIANSSVTSTTYNATSLLEGTQYYAHVRADCTADGVSVWNTITFTTTTYCEIPGSLSATNITVDSADLSWTEMGEATTWDIMYGLASFDTTGTIPTVSGLSSPSYVLSGLTDDTSYEFYVVGAGCNTWAGPYSFSTLEPPPANDDCENAVALTVNADDNCGIVTAGSTYLATASAQADDVTGTPNNDVWYSFVAVETAHQVSLTNVTAIPSWSSSDMGIGVYDGSGSCSSLVFFDDSDPNYLELTGLTPNATYYVRVYGWYGTNQANFDICIGTIPPPPVNDDCTNAITLTCGDVATENTTYALSDAATGYCSAGTGSTPGIGVWYKFVGTGEDVQVSLCGSDFDTKLHLYEATGGTCGTLTCLDSNDDGSLCSANQSALTFTSTIGATYYILANGWSASVGNLEIAITCIPAGSITWNGTTNDYNTASNWSSGAVPTCSESIFIPLTANNPMITGLFECDNFGTAASVNPSVTISGTLSICGNVSLSTGTNISGDGAMVLLGSNTSGSGLFDVAGNASIACLSVQSDYTATGSLNISTVLALDGGNFDATNATVTLESGVGFTAYFDDFSSLAGGNYTGNMTSEQLISNGPGEDQHFVTSPMNNSPMSELGDDVSAFGINGLYGTDGVAVTVDDCTAPSLVETSNYGNVFEYDESLVVGCELDGWVVRSAGTMQNGRGYSAYLSSGSTIDFTGTPVTGTVGSASLSNTTTGIGTGGWHLLGNPYPSPMNVDAVTSNAGLTSPQYFVNAGVYTGSYQPYAPSQTVAIGQGFVAQSNGSASFNSSNTDRVASSNPVWYSVEDWFTSKLEIEVLANGFGDRTVLYYSEDNTAAFDVRGDCVKKMSNIGQPTIYTSLGNQELSMNGKSLVQIGESVPMGVKPGADGTFTLSFTGIETFEEMTTIYVEDKLLGIFHNIENGDYDYTSVETDNSDRFEIHFVLPVELTITNMDCQGNLGSISLESTIGTADRDFVLSTSTNVLASNQLVNLNEQVTAGNYILSVNDAFGGNQVYNVEITQADVIVADLNVSSLNVEVGEVVNFNSLTLNATDVEWSIDGSTISGVSNATYSFNEVGIYPVVLHVSNEECDDTKTVMIEVTNKTTSIVYVDDNQSIKVYSVGTELVLEFINSNNSTAILNVENVIGQRVYNGVVTTEGTQRVNISDVKTGYYFVSLNIEGTNVSTKVLLTK